MRARVILAPPDAFADTAGPPDAIHAVRFASSHAFTANQIKRFTPAASFFQSPLLNSRFLHSHFLQLRRQLVQELPECCPPTTLGIDDYTELSHLISLQSVKRNVIQVSQARMIANLDDSVTFWMHRVI